MAVTVTTAIDAISPRVDALVRADPVRGTILGTISLSLSLGDGAWCASPIDAPALAVRSSALTPLALAGDWPHEDLEELAILVDGLPELAGVSGPEALVRPVAAALAQRRPGRVAREMSQRLFRLDALTPPKAVSGEGRRAGPDERPVVLDFHRAFAAEAGAHEAEIEQTVDRELAAGGCWLWVDGAIVSMAVRHEAVAGSARVGPVYTPPGYRGHGYGSAVTAAATADVLAVGAVPVLFTDLANPVSNAIYPPLGYYAVEDRIFVRFS